MQTPFSTYTHIENETPEKHNKDERDEQLP
jgi:hypothetical protein